MTQPAVPAPTESELLQLAGIMEETFILRHDLFGYQRPDGNYRCSRTPFKPEYLVDHLQNKVTLGAYALNEQSCGRFMVLDADDDDDWLALVKTARGLINMGVTPYLEHSRRGGHLWLFFEDLLPGDRIRQFGRGLMAHFGLENIELFPKQGELKDGPGSMIRLPFGRHRRSGRRYGFCTVDGDPLAPTLRQQIRLLESPVSVPAVMIDQFIRLAPVERRRQVRPLRVLREGGGQAQNTADRIVESIPLREFILQYVELSPTGKGLCPFHHDTIESLSVSTEKNLWYCFACEIGGTIIQFWMHYHNLSYREAVDELAALLDDPWPSTAEWQD